MGESRVHDLKTLPEFFGPVRRGEKRFEVRRDDRAFRKGDILRLREWDGTAYTGRSTDVRVTYVLEDAERFGLMTAYVVLSIEPVAPADDPLPRLLYRTLTGGEWVEDGHLTLEQRQCIDLADAVRAGGYVRGDAQAPADADLDALERRARDSLWHFVPNAVPSPAPPTGEEVLALLAEVRRLRAALRDLGSTSWRFMYAMGRDVHPAYEALKEMITDLAIDGDVDREATIDAHRRR